MVCFVDAVAAVTVMSVLLVVLHVCTLRKCEGDGYTDVCDGGGVVNTWMIYVIQVLYLA